ncbi:MULTISPECIES: type II toxin-antitoxin system VapC family toxin [unclassified Helicobacter]|uniref:type II toxin-antitoxin system tRNA(fMet)-specific endonuclease VapC n=1 Tax=unclassified Helicobacter TaxID=2593540 RepID=UPI0015F14864|nr:MULTISPECIES: type II toxin-antitoxin system VapC family toxin [unclassified Helicobacter]
MVKYLLDTNTIIYAINKTHKSVLERIAKCDICEIATCSIVASELCFGVAKSTYKTQNEIALDKMLNNLVILDFGLKEAKAYGAIRAKQEQNRQLIGNMDMLIAAVAIANDLILVTNNEKDFSRIAELKLENWIL